MLATEELWFRRAFLSRRGCPVLLLLFLCFFLVSCRTPGRLPAANLTEPGWTVYQGQLLWKPPGQTVEIAAEFLAAFHPDGRSIVQATKNPFPLVIAQTDAQRWQIEFVPDNRFFSGRKPPPARLVWFQLLPGLSGHEVSPPWRLNRLSKKRLAFENPKTGERIELWCTS
ncbi:MAG: hypothetical protein AB1813_28890 [Verrucomicrobiota bacterium]|jgi:hypothetical protein